MTEFPKRPVVSEPFVDQMDLIDKTLVEIQNQPSSIYTVNKRKQQFNGRKYNMSGGNMYSNPQVQGQNPVQQNGHMRTHRPYSQGQGQVQGQTQAPSQVQAQAHIQAQIAQAAQGHYGSNPQDLGYGDYNMAMSQSGLSTNDMYSGGLNSTYKPPPMIFEPLGLNDGLSLSTNNVLTNYNAGQTKLGPNIWGSSTGGQGFGNDATVWG